MYDIYLPIVVLKSCLDAFKEFYLLCVQHEILNMKIKIVYFRILKKFLCIIYPQMWTLIYPSSGACDYSVELSHWSYFS